MRTKITLQKPAKKTLAYKVTNDLTKEDMIFNNIVIKGSEVIKRLKKMGSDEGVSDELGFHLSERSFSEKKVSIIKLLAQDPDLSYYIKNEKLRLFKKTQTSIPPIVGTEFYGTKGFHVFDGYNRIKQAMINGEKDIKVLLETSNK